MPRVSPFFSTWNDHASLNPSRQLLSRATRMSPDKRVSRPKAKFDNSFLSHKSVLKKAKQPVHVDLLLGDGLSHALHIGNLVDGVQFADLLWIYI